MVYYYVESQARLDWKAESSGGSKPQQLIARHLQHLKGCGEYPSAHSRTVLREHCTIDMSLACNMCAHDELQLFSKARRLGV